LFQLGTEPPGEPLSVGILKKMKDSVILDWLFPVDNGGSPITEYEIEIWDNTTAAWKFQGSTPAADIGPHCACPHTLASTSYTVTGLKQDHQYLFRVYAKNSIGRSKPAETSTLAAPKKPEEPPSTPRGPVNIHDISSQSCTISWSTPEDSGNSPLLGYNIEARNIKSQEWHHRGFSRGYINKFTVDGLVDGQSYEFRISAENMIGISAPLYSDTCITARSNLQLPLRPPGSLQVTSITHDSVSLEWLAPVDLEGPPISAYIVEKREVHQSTWVTIARLPCSETKFLASNLQEGVEYYFSVLAENSDGQSEPLITEKRIRPTKPPGVPGKPGPLKLISKSPNSVTVAWTAPADDGGRPLTGYLIQYSLFRMTEHTCHTHILEPHDPRISDWILAGSVDAETFQHTVRNMQEGSGYYLRVVPLNELGVGVPTELDAHIVPRKPTGPPSPLPGKLDVIEVTSREVKLSWRSPVDEGGAPVIGYVIQRRGTKRDAWLDIANIDDIKVTSLTVSQVFEGESYYFQVMAVNKEGRGPPIQSQMVTVENPYNAPKSPQCIKVANVTSSTVLLAWEAPTDDTPIHAYYIEKKDTSKDIWIKVARVTSNILSYDAHHVISGHEYYFRVSAENDFGKSDPCVTNTAVRAISPTGAIDR